MGKIDGRMVGPSVGNIVGKHVGTVEGPREGDTDGNEVKGDIEGPQWGGILGFTLGSLKISRYKIKNENSRFKIYSNVNNSILFHVDITLFMVRSSTHRQCQHLFFCIHFNDAKYNINSLTKYIQNQSSIKNTCINMIILLHL